MERYEGLRRLCARCAYLFVLFGEGGRARFATLETRALEFFESFQIYPKFRQSSRRIEFVFSFATILSNIVGLDVEGLRKKKKKNGGRGKGKRLFFFD